MLSRDTAMEIPRPSRRRQQRHRVGGDIRINGCDREAVLDRLRDQQSIEWITVERRERCQVRHRALIDRQGGYTVGRPLSG